MTNDTISDFLTRIRNAGLIGAPQIELPANKQLIEIAKLFLKEGYVRSFELLENKDKNYKTLRVLLKYDEEGYPVLRKLKRVSRPGLRKYYGVDNLPKILQGAGVAIVSTSKGLLSDREARREGVGGEVLCYVY